jgi:hypothetical protein
MRGGVRVVSTGTRNLCCNSCANDFEKRSTTVGRGDELLSVWCEGLRPATSALFVVQTCLARCGAMKAPCGVPPSTTFEHGSGER